MARILVVEDDAINRRLFCEILGRMGHQTTEADDGLSAVECARQLQPDLILMDIMLPSLRGDEAARRIRQFIPPTVRIVALTAADSSRTDIDSAVFDDFLDKPFQIGYFMEEIRKFLEASTNG